MRFVSLGPPGWLAAEAKTLALSNRIAEINKVPWSPNIASQELAKYGRLNNRTDVWLGSGPETILDSIIRDCNSIHI